MSLNRYCTVPNSFEQKDIGGEGGGTNGGHTAHGTAPPGLLLEVKDPEVLVTDALCEETDTPKENRVHLVCDENEVVAQHGVIS